jgi:hypothetical protein
MKRRSHWKELGTAAVAGLTVPPTTWTWHNRTVVTR